MSDARLLDTFLELVRIDSPPGYEAAAARYCESVLRSVGFDVHFDDSAAVTRSDTGNLIATLAGTAPGVLGLSAHLDVVEPCRGIRPVVSDGIIVSAGPTVLGADDRAGLAATLEVVRRLVESEEPHPGLRVIFTVQEEVGLLGAKSLHPKDVECDLCLVLDAAGRPGGIVVAAPTHYTFSAVFLGCACHAGVCPEQGVSAITAAANAILRMELGRLDDATTANIGSIRGGTVTNVVAGRCTVTGECRSLDPDRVERVRETMDAAMRAAATEAGATVDIAWRLEYQGFSYAEDSAEVRLVASACTAAGCEPVAFRTGGGSDANVLAQMGVSVLALACGMESVHGVNEQIAVEDLEALVRIVLETARVMASNRGAL